MYMVTACVRKQQKEKTLRTVHKSRSLLNINTVDVAETKLYGVQVTMQRKTEVFQENS